LVAIGRRATSLSFVCFAMTLLDLIQSRVIPLAMRAQAVAGASWDMDKMCDRAISNLRDDVAALKRLRRWAFVLSLLHQFLDGVELRRMCFALIAPSKRFARLAANIYPLLFRLEDGVCQLSVISERRAGINALSPLCQCASMRRRPGQGARLGEVLRMGERRYQGPEWVTYSVYASAEWKKTGFVAPRFAHVPVDRCATDKRQTAIGVFGRFRSWALTSTKRMAI
jgi:hypothetical protein